MRSDAMLNSMNNCQLDRQNIKPYMEEDTAIVASTDTAKKKQTQRLSEMKLKSNSGTRSKCINNNTNDRSLSRCIRRCVNLRYNTIRRSSRRVNSSSRRNSNRYSNRCMINNINAYYSYNFIFSMGETRGVGTICFTL